MVDTLRDATVLLRDLSPESRDGDDWPGVPPEHPGDYLTRVRDEGPLEPPLMPRRAIRVRRTRPVYVPAEDVVLTPFAVHLRRIRRAQKIGQRELSRRIGKHQQWVSALEMGRKGTRMRFGQVADIVAALELDPESPDARLLAESAGRLIPRNEEITDLVNLFATDSDFRAAVRSLVAMRRGGDDG